MLELAASAREAVPGLWAVALLVERRDGAPAPHPGATVRVPDGLDLDSLKDHAVAAGFRRLSWRVGIDPTKNRPAGEALARRVLAGKGLPQILPLVDAYNRASAATLVPLGAYDMAQVSPPIKVRTARAGETFHGIMRDPEPLAAGRLVYADAAGTVCGVFLWRDAQATSVRPESKQVLIMAVGGEPLSGDVGRVAIQAAAREAIVAGYEATGDVIVAVPA